MSDDYLWDGSGPPDPEVARLETLLRPLRHEGAPPDVSRPSQHRAGDSVGPPRVRLSWFAVPLTIAALLTLVAVDHRVRHPLADGDWSVVGASGSAGFGEGSWLETADAAATVRVGRIGTVDVAPHTRVQLLETEDERHRLRLARGTLRAVIVAPPGQFVVDTPSSTAIDLGCAYTLTVDEGGNGQVTVTSGWVAFERGGRESFVPAGSAAATYPDVGPGTPYRVARADVLREPLAVIDTSDDAAARGEALTSILDVAVAEDVVTLWHLLPRAAAGDRDRVFDTLARFAPPPAGVTKDGVRAADRPLLDAWWQSLGLGTASWWRIWKQPWQDNR